MMDARKAAERLVDHALSCGLLNSEDRTWAYNTALAHLEGADLEAGGVADEDLAANVMGLIMPRPSEVAATFWKLHAQSPRMATDYLYRLSCDANYVRTEAIARNVCWEAQTQWGVLQITINRTKPEKDPRDIARLAAPKVQAASDAVDYPACRLCVENEGYWGRPEGAPGGEYPPRGNLRIVPMRLGGQQWGMQYSPYAYYNEHCIAMNSLHIPMHVDRSCLQNLFDFVDLLPHYFIGSNAGLPVVGGSILNHDHFQGGRCRFPMDDAPRIDSFEVPGFPNVDAAVLKWPVSVLSLRCEDRCELIDCADHILETWSTYDDAEVGIVSITNGVPHNAVTPILRKDAGVYTLNMALRNNITSEEHPLGVFHPHEELHHIKKENIGLIEVMGLAILPPRLAPELAAVADALVANKGLPHEELLALLEQNPLTRGHAAWACEVAARRSEMNADNASEILKQEVGCVFAQVLETTGVFKWDDAGRGALRRFLDAL